jgi:DNA repair exonuclease SbcCD ATPase subunit
MSSSADVPYVVDTVDDQRERRMQHLHRKIAQAQTILEAVHAEIERLQSDSYETAARLRARHRELEQLVEHVSELWRGIHAPGTHTFARRTYRKKLYISNECKLLLRREIAILHRRHDMVYAQLERWTQRMQWVRRLESRLQMQLAEKTRGTGRSNYVQ